MSNTFQPIFIIGCPRSGTSLISSILNRHSKICVTPELHYFSHLEARGPITSKAESLNFYNSLHNKNLVNITENNFLMELNNSPHEQLDKSVFFSICNAYKKKRGKSICIEKTPDNVRFVEKILSLFPNSKFIYIIRDGRDVALSLNKVDWEWPYQGFQSNFIYWHSITHKLSTNKHIQSTNTHLIRYEDLLDDPNIHIGKVCNFLNIIFEAEMLIPNGSENDLIEPTTTTKDNIRKKILPNNKFKWKTELSSVQKSLSWRLASNELSRYYYKKPPIYHASKKSIKSGINTIQFGILSNEKTIEALWELGYEIIPANDGSVANIIPNKNDYAWIINRIFISHKSNIKNFFILLLTTYNIVYAKLFRIKIVLAINEKENTPNDNWAFMKLLYKIIKTNSTELNSKTLSSPKDQAELIVKSITNKKKQ